MVLPALIIMIHILEIVDAMIPTLFMHLFSVVLVEEDLLLRVLTMTALLILMVTLALCMMSTPMAVVAVILTLSLLLFSVVLVEEDWVPLPLVSMMTAQVITMVIPAQ